MKLSTYLMFDGNCREAFMLYQAVLGGKLTAMMDHRGTPAEEHVPEAWKDKILHACLEVEGQMPMAETFWSPRFGMLRDRFGTNWMIGADMPADKANCG